MIGGWEPPTFKWYEKLWVYPLLFIEWGYMLIREGFITSIDWILGKILRK